MSLEQAPGYDVLLRQEARIVGLLRQDGSLEPSHDLVRVAYEVSGQVSSRSITAALQSALDAAPAVDVHFKVCGTAVRQFPNACHPVYVHTFETVLNWCQEPGEPFQLDSGSCRIFVGAEEKEGRALILLEFDHSVIDGWALDLFLQSVTAFFRSPNPAGTVSAPPAEYFSVVHEMRSCFANPTAETQEKLASWQRRVVQETILPALPDVLLRRVGGSSSIGRTSPHSGASALDIRKCLPTCSPLAPIAREARLTPFEIFATATLTTLAQLGGSNDVGILTPISNRQSAMAFRTIGMLAEPLPIIVTDPTNYDSNHELAREVRHLVSPNMVVPFPLLRRFAGLNTQEWTWPRVDFAVEAEESPTFKLNGLSTRQFPLPERGPHPGALLLTVSPSFESIEYRVLADADTFAWEAADLLVSKLHEEVASFIALGVKW